MNSQTYAGVSEKRFEQFFTVYRELCSKSLRISVPLGIATFGQLGLYAPLFQAHLVGHAEGLAMFIGAVPVLVCATLTFCNWPPPINPRNFRRLLIFAMSWYSVSMAFLIVLGILELIPKDPRGGSLIPFWVCSIIGAASLPTALHYQRLLRAQEK